MKFEITGKNLILRRLRPRFTNALYNAAHESRGGEFTRWMPWCHADYAISETESFIAACEQNWARGAEYNFAVFDRADDALAGLVSLNCFDAAHRLFNLGYWIRVSRQGRGLASAAARRLAATAFETFADLNRLEILAAAENLPSQKAAEKAGATREGVLRQMLVIDGRVHDAVVYSFVRKDFR